MISRKDEEKKDFKDMTIKEIIQMYVGSTTSVNYSPYYRPGEVHAGIGDLVTMIKSKDVEIACLKDKIEFLERIVNQVFAQVEKDTSDKQ